MVPPRFRRVLAVAVFATLAVGCSTTSSDAGVLTLEFVGRIPGVEPDGSAVVIDGVRSELPLLDGEKLGPRSGGNRLLMIGDSIFESTSRRYGGEMCATLVPLGWRVAVEARSGELVGFGRRVVRERINDGWDAAVVFLGTNFGGDQKNYENDLTRIVDALAPRPTLLLTTTLYRDSMKLVNESIRRVAAQYPNAAVLDWGAASLQPGLLNRDSIHPTDQGRAVLAASVAAALGNAPRTPGACLMSMSELPLDEDDDPSTTTSTPSSVPTSEPTTTTSSSTSTSSTSSTSSSTTSTTVPSSSTSVAGS